ncbi:hypothetical protein B0H15DRAFT_1025278 [Mycena belliarum]|uniref:Uncharacterized protein n=1 Tax=Mycena belliarum TaxID=1033014 RepID=A0AAD6XHY0_9AGAR|nr:hypothetical protein B0H15DRAFT_1025278 [Mycena belliae]
MDWAVVRRRSRQAEVTLTCALREALFVARSLFAEARPHSLPPLASALHCQSPHFFPPGGSPELSLAEANVLALAFEFRMSVRQAHDLAAAQALPRPRPQPRDYGTRTVQLTQLRPAHPELRTVTSGVAQRIAPCPHLTVCVHLKHFLPRPHCSALPPPALASRRRHSSSPAPAAGYRPLPPSRARIRHNQEGSGALPSAPPCADQARPARRLQRHSAGPAARSSCRARALGRTTSSPAAPPHLLTDTNTVVLACTATDVGSCAPSPTTPPRCAAAAFAPRPAACNAARRPGRMLPLPPPTPLACRSSAVSPAAPRRTQHSRASDPAARPHLRAMPLHPLLTGVDLPVRLQTTPGLSATRAVGSGYSIPLRVQWAASNARAKHRAPQVHRGRRVPRRVREQVYVAAVPPPMTTPASSLPPCTPQPRPASTALHASGAPARSPCRAHSSAREFDPEAKYIASPGKRTGDHSTNPRPESEGINEGMHAPHSEHIALQALPALVAGPARAPAGASHRPTCKLPCDASCHSAPARKPVGPRCQSALARSSEVVRRRAYRSSGGRAGRSSIRAWRWASGNRHGDTESIHPNTPHA